jgi:hypothetical protein
MRGTPYAVATSVLSGSVYEAVATKLDASGASPTVLELWTTIEAQFQEGGPEAVKSVLDKRARSLASAATRDLKASRAVATAVGPQRRRATAPKPAAKRTSPGRAR